MTQIVLSLWPIKHFIKVRIKEEIGFNCIKNSLLFILERMEKIVTKKSLKKTHLTCLLPMQHPT